MMVEPMPLFVSIGLIFVFVLATVYILSKCASALGLMALPGEHRLHQSATPMVGGIAICFGLILGVLLTQSMFPLLFPGILLMCFIGVLDDRFTLPSWSRFLAQGLAAYLVIMFTNVVLLDLGYLFSGGSRILMSDFWAIPMTIFACIGVINAINMSDGLDGLAGSLILLVLVALLVIGHPSQILILVTISSVAGFLFWNLRVGRSQAKVYMGDAGSMMLGLLIAFLLIQYSQHDGGIFPVTALWLLALPLIDTVAVLIVRPLRGRSPFSADRIHYHHLLLGSGLSVNASLLTAIMLQLVFIGLGFYLWTENVAEYIQLLAFLSIFLLYVIRLYFFSEEILASE